MRTMLISFLTTAALSTALYGTLRLIIEIGEVNLDNRAFDLGSFVWFCILYSFVRNEGPSLALASECLLT